MTAANRAGRQTFLSVLWVIAAALPSTNGIAWIWAGARVHRKQWLVRGAFFSGLNIVLIHLYFTLSALLSRYYIRDYVGQEMYALIRNVYDFIFPVFVLTAIVSFVYAVLCRKEFLVASNAEPGPTSEQRKEFRKGELANSIWLVIATIPGANCLAWLWAGLTSRRKRWTVIGCIMLVYNEYYGNARTISDFIRNMIIGGGFGNLRTIMVPVLVIGLALSIFSFIYGINVREKVLVIQGLEANRTPKLREAHRQKILGDYPSEYRDSRYEDRGARWARGNSWWLILVLYCFLSVSFFELLNGEPIYFMLAFTYCFAFLYIAITARQKKWMLIGFIHMAVFSTAVYILDNRLMLYISDAGYDVLQGRFIDYILGAVMRWSVITAAIQAVCIRREYLIRRDIVLKMSPKIQEQRQQDILDEYHGKKKPAGTRAKRDVQLPGFVTGGASGDQVTGKLDTAPETTAPKPVQEQLPEEIASLLTDTPEVAAPPAETPAKLDLNRCTEQQLATLPGVGIVLAKKAITLRREKGGFSSVGDFISSLSLRPHFAEQIAKTCVASPAAPAKGGGRVLDI